jgi:hypothetical protein
VRGAGPVRVIVPYPPAGGSDAVARTIYPRVSARLGQPVGHRARHACTAGFHPERLSPRGARDSAAP